MNRIALLLAVPLLLACSGALWATPSTQLWNPSSDIQAAGTFHLGIDDYFSVSANDTKKYQAPADIGITWGLARYAEVGVDYLAPSADPFMFNAKVGLPESETLPAAAVGGMNFGTKKGVTDYNILYGVIAKTFAPAGRFSLGCYTGNEKLLVDETGGKANTGLIAAWDKTLTDRIWASVDYASGKSYYGSTSLGFSYAFAPNTSVIFGYVIYNNDKVNRNNQVTTQLDINF